VCILRASILSVINSLSRFSSLSFFKESNLIGSGNPSYFPGLSDSYEGLLANVVLSTAFERAMESKKEFGIQTDAPSVIFKSGNLTV